MKKSQYTFSGKITSCYFDADFSLLDKLVDKQCAVLVTDENVFRHHHRKFKGWRTIVIKAGEQYKTQETVDLVIRQLVELEADRKTFLIGVGGGVVTDVSGFVASIYMRGLKFGFVPSSVLAMVDASIGGKNGIDVGVIKNLVGVIRQPDFLLFDISLLRSLPADEWINGFAEIIKHASIRDATLFRELENHSLAYYKKDKKALSALIRKNVMIKSAVVRKDEFEKGERRHLNFGHTMGHAIEKLYGLSHGKAISIGMVSAALLSEELGDFKDAARLKKLLHRYGLPVGAEFEPKKVFSLLRMDKKKDKQAMNYVLLNRIGKATIKSIPLDQLGKLFESLLASR